MVRSKLIVPVTRILSSREAYMYTLKNNWYPIPKTSLLLKKGEDEKVQVTEQPKDVISLWGQEEKLYQLDCVYRTPVYKVNSFK